MPEASHQEKSGCCRGRGSDYFRFKQSGVGDVLPPDVAAWGDFGFVGIEKDNLQSEIVIPHKKSKNGELTPAQY